MQLIVRKDQVELTTLDTDYLERKVEHLMRLADRVDDESSKFHLDVIKTEIKTTDHKLLLKATMHVPHEIMHAEASGVTFQEAVDLLEEKFIRQIERYKAKIHGEK